MFSFFLEIRHFHLVDLLTILYLCLLVPPRCTFTHLIPFLFCGNSHSWFLFPKVLERERDFLFLLRFCGWGMWGKLRYNRLCHVMSCPHAKFLTISFPMLLALRVVPTYLFTRRWRMRTVWGRLSWAFDSGFGFGFGLGKECGYIVLCCAMLCYAVIWGLREGMMRCWLIDWKYYFLFFSGLIWYDIWI